MSNMFNKFKSWLRCHLFNLLKDDIKGLIVREVCHLDPPTSVKEGTWVVNAKLLERPRAQDVRWAPHRTIENSLDVRYLGASSTKKACVPSPPAEVDVREYLLGRPEALL